MAIILRSSFSIDRDQLARAIQEAAKPPLADLAQQLGDRGIECVIEKAREYFPGAGKSNRHRPLTSILDPGAYRFDVEEQPDSFLITWRVQGGDAFKVKFFSLNYGKRDHTITPKRSSRPGGRSTLGTFQGVAAGAPVLSFRGQKIGSPADSHPTSKTVQWRKKGGNWGSRFWEEGITQATTEFGGTM